MDTNAIVLFVYNNRKNPFILLVCYLLFRMLIGYYFTFIIVAFIIHIYFKEYIKNFLESQLDHYGLKN